MPIDPVAENTIEDENDADFELDDLFKEPNNRSMAAVIAHLQQLIFVDERIKEYFFSKAKELLKGNQRDDQRIIASIIVLTTSGVVRENHRPALSSISVMLWRSIRYNSSSLPLISCSLSSAPLLEYVLRYIVSVDMVLLPQDSIRYKVGLELSLLTFYAIRYDSAMALKMWRPLAALPLVQW
jgi:hypothetical protein